jgi:hypothetical protein
MQSSPGQRGCPETHPGAARPCPQHLTGPDAGMLMAEPWARQSSCEGHTRASSHCGPWSHFYPTVHRLDFCSGTVARVGGQDHLSCWGREQSSPRSPCPRSTAPRSHIRVLLSPSPPPPMSGQALPPLTCLETCPLQIFQPVTARPGPLPAPAPVPAPVPPLS